jgi:hypothetical protein
MIQPAEAKERYGFRDASDREDILTMSLLNSVQAVQKSKTVRVVERLMPVIVLGMCVAVGVYAYHNGVQISTFALPILMLLVYIPQIKDNLTHKKEAATIAHDSDVLGTHFLVGYATCLEKREKSVLGGAVYSMKVRLQNGEELDDVLLIRDFYQRIQVGRKLFVAMADSPQAKQLIGIVPAYYDTKVMREKGNEQAERPDSRKLRRITDQERRDCAAYYGPMRRSVVMEQQKNRSFFFLLPAAVLALISFPLDKPVLMSLGLLFLAGYIFTFVADFWELRSTLKALETEQELFVLDTQVSAKPILESQQLRNKAKTQAIDFRDRNGKLVHRSTHRDDWKHLNIGDEVLLVYMGKKQPLACRKPNLPELLDD